MSLSRCFSKYQFWAMLPAVPFFILAGIANAIYLSYTHKKNDILNVISSPGILLSGHVPESVILFSVVLFFILCGFALFFFGAYVLRTRLLVRNEAIRSEEIVSILTLSSIMIWFYVESGMQFERMNFIDFGYDSLGGFVTMLLLLFIFAEHCPRNKQETDDFSVNKAG